MKRNLATVAALMALWVIAGCSPPDPSTADTGDKPAAGNKTAPANTAPETAAKPARPARPAAPNPFPSGTMAPDIEGPDTDGNSFKLSDYRGKVVMLDFWGDWWPPCKAMYPHERSLVKHLAGKPFALIGVNSDRSISTPQNLTKIGKVTWRSFQNQADGRTISDDWQVQSWPTIYLIDAEGKVRYSTAESNDIRNPQKLNEAIAELLSEVGAEFPHEEIEATAKEEAERSFDPPAEPEDTDDSDAAEEATDEEKDTDNPPSLDSLDPDKDDDGG